MGLFRPYDQKTQNGNADGVAVATADAVDSQGPKQGTAPKNRPTPTREQAQAARLDALHPKLTKRQATALDRAASEKKRMAQIQAADNQPERVLLRNYVDSRVTIVQFIWAIMLIVLAGTILSSKFAVVTAGITIFLYVILIACIVTCWWSWRGLKREMAERLPHASTKGLMWMMVTRMMMFPKMRQPKPTISRGEKY